MNNGDRINKKNVFKIIVIAMVLLCPLIVITIGGVSKAFYSDDLPVSDVDDGVDANNTNVNDANEHSEDDEEIELEFELPLNGATGYASMNLSLFGEATADSSNIGVISAGEAFTIISEENNYFYVYYDGKYGWVDSTLCMINLPDVIPSIIYDNTNSYSSLYVSSGVELPGITGTKLYDAISYNERLAKEQYNMPILYSTAKKVNQAQKLALANNQSLKIYETFRSYEVQRKVSSSLKELKNSNEIVNSGINKNGWSEGWFISQGISNHQRGIAMDVSLVDINASVQKVVGDYTYMEITAYTEFVMPTSMHELSAAAVAFSRPVSSKKDRTAWTHVPLASTMTDGAKKLQEYCTTAGLTPLASEWWHFDDLDAKDSIDDYGINGKYYLTDNVSRIPD